MPTALPGLPLSIDDDMVTPDLMKEQQALWQKKNRKVKKTPPPEAKTTTKGGPGSGNHGHAGRPGQSGGSAPTSGGAGGSDLRSWLGKSVIQNVVYHGSPEGKFNNFAPDSSGLIFFTPDKTYAADYANNEGRASGFAGFKPTVHAVYIKVEKPFDMSADEIPDPVADVIEDEMGLQDFWDGNIRMSDFTKNKAIIKAIRRAGFDAILGRGLDSQGLYSQEIAVFDRAQIRAVDTSTTTKGGAGSGNHGHKGVPGHLGGSAQGNAAPATTMGQPGSGIAPQAPVAGQAQPVQAPVQGTQGVTPPVQPVTAPPAKTALAGFHPEAYLSKNVPDRVAAWESLPVEERDRQADARRVIGKNQRILLAEAGERPMFSGNPKKDIQARLAQLKDFSMAESHDRITKVVGEADGLLEKMNIKPEVRYKLGMEMTDALVSQEHEAMTRQLGDHGIHHIQGNIEMATGILEKIPGEDTDRARAQVYIANIFHDTGYMTEPSRIFLDEGHPRWSAEHYDENIRPLVAQAIGPRAARDVTHMILTHAATDIDWKNDPTGSAVRVADNLALFQREKLPPVFRVTGNVGALVDLHNGRIDVTTARTRMIENINKDAKITSDRVRAQLIKGANEVNPMTGKFTLGMLGGRVDKVDWTDGHIRVALKQNQSDTVLNKLLDLGQKQLAKFAKSYKIDPNEFLKNLAFKFPPDGQTLLETVIVGGTKTVKKEVKRVLGILYGRG